MSNQRLTVCGKQIKLDGQHLADAVSEEAAQVIAISLNTTGPFYTTISEQRRLEEFFA
jgi:hypothetical protein